jgi:hypothetical protein
MLCQQEILTNMNHHETTRLYLKYSEPASTHPSHFYLVRELEGNGYWGYEIKHGDFELTNVNTDRPCQVPIERRQPHEAVLNEQIERKEEEGYIRVGGYEGLDPEWKRKIGIE